MGAIAVPVKRLERAKTRLSGVLDERERGVLTLALLQDVLDACLAQPGWDVWVVSDDERVLGVARRRGAVPLRETGATLLAAVRQVQVEVEAGRHEALAIVLGDLPDLTAADLSAALSAPGDVVAAPASSDGGTNVLVRRPPAVIPPRFGRGSFARHRLAARRAGAAFREVRVPGLLADLDRPEDLARLLGAGRDGHARAACLGMGLDARLAFA